MSLKNQKRLAASLLGGGLNRVWIDPEENDRVQSAITRDEIKSLIREGRISLLPKTGISRGRHRAKSGRRKKAGSRKGGQKPGKEAWVLKIRAIRRHLRWLRDKRQLSAGNYTTLLGMAKGGAPAARRAVQRVVKEAILDLGLKGPTKGSKLFAVLKGLADSGLTVPHSPEKLPPMERIGGNHIATYAKSLAGEHDLYKKRFSAYLSRGLKPEDLSGHFEEIRKTVSTAPLEAAK